MREKLILTIDYGTQSVRVSLFDCKGKALAMEKETYDPPYFSPKPGYAEQNPDSYYESFCKCSRRIAEKHPELLKDVVAITQTCFRDSAVMLDKDLKVIRPMVLWLDQRFSGTDRKMPFLNRLILRLVGMYNVMEMNRRRTIANWMIENEPENWGKCHKYAPVSAYFIYKMVGRLADASASITGHYPMDFKNRAWYKDVQHNLQGCIFSLRQDQLVEIVPEGQTIGSITDECSKDSGIPAGIPVIACGSDKSCETLGTGVINNTAASVSLGTACTVETTIRKYVTHDGVFPAYPSCIPGYYNLDVQIYRGYWMINWFLKEFGAKRVDDLILDEANATEFNEKLKDVPPGSDGLVLQPYWGSLLERPLVRGSIVGFSDVTTRTHVYRALIEGIFYGLREGLEGFEKCAKTQFDEIRVSGGGSQSPEICQICADVFGIPVKRVQTNETSSLGAAMAGFIAIGKYRTAEEAASKMVSIKDVFQPNAENHATYDHYFKNVYKKLYPSLKTTYETIWNTNKR